MTFGLAIPYNEARLVARLAQTAEEAGWDGIFLGDYIWCEDPLIALAAAAMTTSRVRLGTMVIPAPLKRPWRLASESLAVDRLSNGRLILGLATGATWMGWQAFPDEVTDPKARAGMLEETIDILTLLYKGKQFDYDGKYYHLKLTLMEEMHYPARPIQQPRIPLWAPVVCGQKRSMQRALQCDGLFAEKRGPGGAPAEASPADIAETKAYIEANRSLSTPFDIVVSGKMSGKPEPQQRDELQVWAQAGATWWIEGLWGETQEAVTEHIRQGPPG